MAEDFGRDLKGTGWLDIAPFFTDIGVMACELDYGKVVAIAGMTKVGEEEANMLFIVCRSPEQVDDLIGRLLKCKALTWLNNESSPSNTNTEATP